MNLKDFIEKTGLTGYSFAKISGIERWLIYSYLRGDLMPRYSTCEKIIKASGNQVTMEALYEFYKKNNKKKFKK